MPYAWPGVYLHFRIFWQLVMTNYVFNSHPTPKIPNPPQIPPSPIPPTLPQITHPNHNSSHYIKNSPFTYLSSPYQPNNTTHNSPHLCSGVARWSPHFPNSPYPIRYTALTQNNKRILILRTSTVKPLQRPNTTKIDTQIYAITIPLIPPKNPAESAKIPLILSHPIPPNNTIFFEHTFCATKLPTKKKEFL